MAKRGVPWGAWLGAMLAAAGVIVPILWERYATRTALELRLSSAVSLVEPSTDLAGLQITYSDRVVPRLGQMEFDIENTGRRPIIGQDVVTPVYVEVHEGRVLDARLASVAPSDLQASVAVSPDSTRVSLVFPLLNPSDRVRVSVLATGTVGEFQAGGRVAGLRSLTIVRPNASDGTFRLQPTWSTYVVGAFTLLLWALTIGIIFLLGGEHLVGELVKRGELTIPRLQTTHEYLAWLSGFAARMKNTEVTEVRAYLTGLPEATLAPEQQEDVVRRITSAMTNKTAALSALGLLSVLALVGTIYTITSIIGG